MSRTYAAALAAVALVVAGCGGDDNKKSSSAAPTKAQYIAKADAICAIAKAKTKSYNDQLDALPGNAQIKDTVPLLQGGLTTSRTASVKLHALKRPTEDKAMLDSYLASLDDTLVAGEKLVAAAKTNSFKAVQAAGGANPTLKANRRRIAKQYGFKHCA
jgi:hypothetical protein